MRISGLTILAHFLANIAFLRMIWLMTGSIMSFTIGNVAQSFAAFEAGLSSFRKWSKSNLAIVRFNIAGLSIYSWNVVLR